MQLRWIWPLLAAACARGRAEQASSYGSGAEFEVRRVARLSEPGGLAFALRNGADPAPGRLGKDLREGRTWLHVRKPRGFTFAVDGLLKGREIFVARDVSIAFERSARTPREPRRDPVVLQLEGVVAPGDVARLVAVVPDPGLEIQGLDAIQDPNLRVLLGHGIDQLVALEPTHGVGATDTREWVALLDERGRVVALDETLASVRRARSVESVRGHRVFVRRWRPSAPPQVIYLRLSFVHVLLATQMAIKGQGEGCKWTWVGLWEGDMGPQPRSIVAPDWKAPRSLVLRYREYRLHSDSSPYFWPDFARDLVWGTGAIGWGALRALAGVSPRIR